MKVGEIWKLKLKSPFVLINEDNEPTPENIIMLPNKIELISINNPPPNTIAAVEYPRLHQRVVIGKATWGFSVKELVTYFSKDYDASR